MYLLRVINKDELAHVYDLSVAGLPTIALETDPEVIEVQGGEVATVAARVLIEDGAVATGGHDIQFSLVATDTPALATNETSRFISP